MVTENLIFSAISGIASLILLILTVIILRRGLNNWSRIIFFTWLLMKTIWFAAGSITYLAQDIFQFEVSQTIFYSLLYPISLLIPIFSTSFTSKRTKDYYWISMVIGFLMVLFFFSVRPYVAEVTPSGFNYLLWDIIVLPTSLFIIFSFLLGAYNLWRISNSIRGDMRKKLRNLGILIMFHMLTTLPIGIYAHLIRDSTFVPAVSSIFDSVIFVFMLKVYLGK